jgi:two-component system response regulator FlrC
VSEPRAGAPDAGAAPRLAALGPDAAELARTVRAALGAAAPLRVYGTQAELLEALRAGAGLDLLLLEVGQDVAAVARGLLAERIALPIIAYGRDASPRAAAAAIKAGAREFLPLPPDAELIAAMLRELAGPHRALIAEDPASRALIELATRYAQADAPVLLSGESGTGKEVVARFLHRAGRRAARPFISVNCAAIPEQLLESELFGHERGAFTGAVARRIGKFEEAHGGTLLLDEITEMDLRLQAKLLRALQEREIDRVGGQRPVPVDIRVIATTNRDLAGAVAAGRFRADLMFRLAVLELELPPLRARPGDLAPLARHFARKFALLNGLPERPLAADALGALARHDWPGNVRELENRIHRAVLLASGPAIDAAALGPLRAGPPRPPAGGDPDGALVGRTVAEVERRLIHETLAHTAGNRTRAAALLGISIRTLRNKLREQAALA